jgi:hypothetical protein
MTDFANLSALGTAALQQGIKFLYEQAGEALKWRRERRSKTAAPQPAAGPVPPIFHDHSGPFTFHLDKIEAVEELLRPLVATLAKWAEGKEPVNPASLELIAATAALRLAMEHIFQRPLTFKGEQRASNGAAGVVTTSIRHLVDDLLAPLGLKAAIDVNIGVGH